jgi:hypothetical protein
MTTTLIGLTQCPGCSSANLVPVVAELEVNFFCEDCTLCWHLVGQEIERVDPKSCAGCRLGSTACFEHWEVDAHRWSPERGFRSPLPAFTLGAADAGWDDVEAELTGSAREASMGWCPLFDT